MSAGDIIVAILCAIFIGLPILIAKIQISKGEFYALTITEAEKNGFRHAMKHFYVS